LPTIVLLSKFFLPALLFLLAYRFIRKLTDDEKTSANIFIAITGSLLVTLGIDLTDLSRLIRILTGAGDVGGMPIWTRPVNPISGALLLFLFLNLVWSVTVEKRKHFIIPAGLTLSMMFASYFFSWGLAISVLFILGLSFALRKEFTRIINLGWIVLTGIIGATPYWILVATVHSNPLFAELSGRFGLIRTHDPLFNKVLLAAFGIFGGISILFWKKQQLKESSWWPFCVAMLGGGLVALNQQIITGVTIWPFHFVQYTVPFAYIVLLVIFYRLIPSRYALTRHFIFGILAIIPISFTIYTEVLDYQRLYPKFVARQQWADIFDWLNDNTPKDSVVFINDNVGSLDLYIPAYTHNNLYFSQSIIMAPRERFIRSYMSFLRLKGVTGDQIDAYLKDPKSEATNYLYTNLFAVLRPGNFGNERDDELDATLARLPEQYRQFLKEDFLTALKTNRLDYVLSKDELSEDLLASLGNPTVVRLPNGIFIYHIL
ncbi:hypothetical protein KKA39_03335, partial [Patescibacteria group bacterium]|nr:hypothetical protein [Patescibacteria group bacterium]